MARRLPCFQKYNDLLQLMLNSEDSDECSQERTTGGGLSKTELLAQGCSLMAAGYDSTGILLQFALYHVAKLEDVQRRLHAEIDAVVEDCVSKGNAKDASPPRLVTLPGLPSKAPKSEPKLHRHYRWP